MDSYDSGRVTHNGKRYLTRLQLPGLGFASAATVKATE